MRILGIDPGYERLGIAVLEKNHGDKKETLLFSTCFKTKAALPLPERIFMVGAEVARVINDWKPTALAIEKLYFEKNTSSAMGVSEARGAIIYAARNAGLDIIEFTPQQIKSAVTGYGKATKDGVQSMVRKLIVIPAAAQSATTTRSGGQDDEIDAIAIALTGFATCKIR